MSKIASVDARRLDQKIRLERKTEVRDSTGDLVPTWGTLMDRVNAAVDGLPLSPQRSETVLGQRLTAVSDAVFYVRSDIIQRTGLTPLDRVIWKNIVYDIRDLPPPQLRERLVAIVGQSGVNNG